MSVDRRNFLKMAGLASVATIGGGKAIEAVAQTASGAEFKEMAGGKSAHRWAMVIDTRKCLEHEDCNSCQAACHKIHNVPEFDNPKDEIKWIWKHDAHGAFPEQIHHHMPHDMAHKNFIVMCNHCDNPPCVRVCPTQTTWRREDGIVMMDMHRCIGCRYCITACPYGSRSFNWRDPRPHIDDMNADFPTRCRGVVEKCNFCAERLAQGLMPACVEACEHKALTFGDIEDPESKVRHLLEEHHSIRRKPSLGTHPEVYYLV